MLLNDGQAHAYNIGFGKMGADGSRVSAVVILLCFISGWTLRIELSTNHQH